MLLGCSRQGVTTVLGIGDGRRIPTIRLQRGTRQRATDGRGPYDCGGHYGHTCYVFFEYKLDMISAISPTSAMLLLPQCFISSSTLQHLASRKKEGGTTDTLVSHDFSAKPCGARRRCEMRSSFSGSYSRIRHLRRPPRRGNREAAAASWRRQAGPAPSEELAVIARTAGAMRVSRGALCTMPGALSAARLGLLSRRMRPSFFNGQAPYTVPPTDPSRGTSQ